MNSSFNRQFILIDFRLLTNKKFLKFIGSSEFATYLVLRCNVWRSQEPHYMGLHELHLKRQLLACSLERSKISEVTGIDPDNISRHLSNLAKKQVVKRVRTGRQNIYVLGEWVDVNGDGSFKLEWFYLEGKYGISKSDLTLSVRSDAPNLSDQTPRKASGLTLRKASDNNIRENREKNTVNGDLRKLKNLGLPEGKVEYIAEQILSQLGDRHSSNFYKLIAAKVPENVIFKALAEIKADGAESPPKVFTHRMKKYALTILTSV